MIARSLAFDRTGALRAPWCILLFLLAGLAFLLVLEAASAPLERAIGVSPAIALLLQAVRLTLALLGAHVLALRITGRGDWGASGLARDAARPRALLLGFLVGVLAIGVPSLLLLAIGWLRFEAAPPGGWLTAMAGLLVLLGVAAAWEELLARGYPFAVIRSAVGAPAAVILTSVAFGLLHLGNPGANLQAVLQVVFAGVWLAGVLLATGSLYAAWMAHLGWNWMMAAVLHAPVSGLEFPTPGYRLVDAGPAWATGGGWGPEGGLAATFGMAGSLIYLYARRRRREES